jgi:hypothetical protein
MALVVPLASSANVISDILFKVRRGIALSRNASQANSNTGVMVDLPDKIDFEMTLLRTHQSMTFQRRVQTTANEGGSESRATRLSESSATSKSASNSESTGTREQSLSQDSEGKKAYAKGNESSKQNSNESGNSSESQSTAENASGGGNGNGNENASGNGTESSNESEQRCTFQKHEAFRYYDKFDTDTGIITGVSA